MFEDIHNVEEKRKDNHKKLTPEETENSGKWIQFENDSDDSTVPSEKI